MSKLISSPLSHAGWDYVTYVAFSASLVSFFHASFLSAKDNPFVGVHASPLQPVFPSKLQSFTSSSTALIFLSVLFIPIPSLSIPSSSFCHLAFSTCSSDSMFPAVGDVSRLCPGQCTQPVYYGPTQVYITLSFSGFCNFCPTK